MSKANCQPIDGVCSQCGGRVNAITVCPKGPYGAIARRPRMVPMRISLAAEPGKVQKLSNYAKAVAKWKLAGSPVRTQDEIDSIFAICEACPQFISEGRPRCRLCGCSINKLPDGLKSKIAMATESCPANPPKWAASTRTSTPQSETPPPALGK